MHGSYPSRANGAQSWTAKRRAFYEERKRQRVEAVDIARAAEIVDLLRQVHGRAKAVNTEGVRVLVKKCRERFPVGGATKRQVAHHEAGHIVAYKAEGMAAFKAKIYSSPGVQHDWGGEAWTLDLPNINPRSDALTLLHEARGMIAGPAAGRLFANHDGLSPTLELARARVLVERAAQLTVHDGRSRWRQTIRDTIAIIERHAAIIVELAELLERRKEITLHQPSVRKLLSQIQPRASISAADLSPRGQALARSIEAETPCVEELMEVR